jgi:folate-binding protein YgfZ
MHATEDSASTPSAGPGCPLGWADLPGPSTLLIGGRAAVRFVDNFTTAAVSTLAEGRGTEGFFTDARGWVIALVNILRTPDGLWIDGPPGLAAGLAAHLGHFQIREDVTFVDASDERSSLLIVGAGAADWLAARGIAAPTRQLDHGTARLGGTDAALVRLDWFGPEGWLISCSRDDGPRLAEWLAAEGLPRLAAAAVEAARIEAGSPEPADIPAKTLPQELGRDVGAISFTKGCYLGQETVARLDALGHVNRRLVTLVIDPPSAPAVGAPVRVGAETVGTLTSAGPSPRLGRPLGLAIVHVRALKADARLEVAGRPARVLTRGGREAT